MTARRDHAPLVVVFAGGGTGGHIYPALALAEGLRARLGDGVAVHFVGSPRGLERDLVPRAGWPLHLIPAGGLLAPGLRAKLGGALRTVAGAAAAWRLLGRLGPDVVVGTGGYVSGPAGLAAVVRGVPLVLQEQNVWPGLANRMLARWAAAVLVPFAEAARHLPQARAVRVVGNPVRPDLLRLSRAEARRRLGLAEGWTVVLATGGSQGAPAINRLMAGAWPALAARPDVAVLWATGRRHHAAVRPLLEPAPDGSRLRVVEYFYEMDAALRAADVMVGRAGAMTCAEAVAVGLPALLVPSAHVAEDHQTKNARYLAGQGAAVVVAEDRVEVDGPKTLMALVDDPVRRQAMSARARALFRADALARAVDAIVDAATAGRRA
ncbi:MAG: undecaprenyldiphospho-muramoylpentapeptide beta-N-acetylglucosaminyltransferase [Actinomycetia bacterium]|nr:undecaprenyldiphospho-muramoylpentapeptide beta-N-acetylglucosaminyltransferase [Actinomycetes bacterium]